MEVRLIVPWSVVCVWVWVSVNAPWSVWLNEKEKVPFRCQWRQTTCSFEKNPNRNCHPVSSTTILCFVHPIKQTVSPSHSRGELHFHLHLNAFPAPIFPSYLTFFVSSLSNLAFQFLLRRRVSSPVQQISVRSTNTVGLSREMNQPATLSAEITLWSHVISRFAVIIIRLTVLPLGRAL